MEGRREGGRERERERERERDHSVALERVYFLLARAKFFSPWIN